jgi:hypothetical protein
LRFRRHHLYVIFIFLVFITLLELTFRKLQRPNIIDVGGDHPFLINTTWHQIREYAKYVVHDIDAGCWATAIAQISHFHRLNPAGKIEYMTTKGEKIKVDLDDYLFDHDQFANYLDKQSTASAKDQVAKYIYYLAALIYTDFGSHGYLSHETMVSRLEKHLDCTVGFYRYTKQKYLSEEVGIRKLIQREIDGQRPLMFYFDNGDDFGHAAALDGYVEQDDRFLVHLNMGWGGRSNGWYDCFEKIVDVRDDLQNRFLITFMPNDITDIENNMKDVY